MEAILEINGEPPELVGKRCDALLVRQFWYEGSLEEPANVVYLCFGGAWHRLYFDTSIIFWRDHDGPPEPWQESEGKGAFPIVDLGTEAEVQGDRLHTYNMELIEGGSRVALVFECGRRIEFENVNDITVYRHYAT